MVKRKLIVTEEGFKWGFPLNCKLMVLFLNFSLSPMPLHHKIAKPLSLNFLASS